MQIIQYEERGNVLLVGFRRKDFAVYVQIENNKELTKQELLQLAYVKAKHSIDYESTLNINSTPTDKKGEEFTPEEPKATELKIDFDKLSGEVLDQYGDVYSTEVEFSIEGTDSARIEDNGIIEDEVDDIQEYFIIAKWSDLDEKKKRTLYPKEVDRVLEIENALSMVKRDIESIVDDMTINVKHELLEVQNYIVEKEYQDLLKEGGL